MKIEINDNEALELLTKRVAFWTDDNETIDLFSQMYENYIDSGVFEDSTFNVAEIVDNDYINWCRIVCEGEDEFEDIKKVYDAQGIGDCSCEDCVGNYIEAVNENGTAFLIRY